MPNGYNIDYNDERFQQVEAEKQEALGNINQTYDGMIEGSDKFYQDQIDASKEWADKQSQLQQEQTDFTVEQIEQQKDKANKDYTKEQSGAYVDWQKQSNQYGVNAEKEASAGLKRTGYSESSQVSMYNTYQNRVATAREAYQYAVLNYDNAIKDARLQNNAKQAEIAYTALAQQLELALQGFQYKNTLILDKTSKQLEVDQMYYQRWRDVLDQMNTEIAFAESQRQFNAQMAMQQAQMAQSAAQFAANQAMQEKQFEESVRQFGLEYALAEMETMAKLGQHSEYEIVPDNVSDKSGGNAKIDKSEEKTTVNIDSLNELGISGLNESRLAELIANGTVKMSLDNGQYYFSWSNPGTDTRSPLIGANNSNMFTHRATR